MLGVLGGGQLGNYFVLAAKSLGYQTAVLDPDPNAPAGKNADRHIIAKYDDVGALTEFSRICTAVTIEFENPPVSSLQFLAQHVVVRPSPGCVAIAQDRREEKRFCQSIGLAVAPYEVIETPEDAARVQMHGISSGHLGPLHLPLLLKTARLGYDGKGQQKITDLAHVPAIWKQLGSVPCVVEQMIPLDAEFSVILARSADGIIAMFEPTLNIHTEGILDISTAPIKTDNTQMMARVVTLGRQAATLIAEQLNYVGVLAVECFVSEGNLYINELAPRPHNSGHWTLDAAYTSQFEQQVRALVDQLLGDPSMKFPAVTMVNFLGDRWANGEPLIQLANANIKATMHLYGKDDARPGRKMGHLTVVGENPSMTTNAALTLRDAMTL
jgi:5-(carboxyamino)imidazole ribonucleotide synthase